MTVLGWVTVVIVVKVLTVVNVAQPSECDLEHASARLSRAPLILLADGAGVAPPLLRLAEKFAGEAHVKATVIRSHSKRAEPTMYTACGLARCHLCNVIVEAAWLWKLFNGLLSIALLPLSNSIENT